MQYFSTQKQAPKVGFKEAVVRSLAPDKGLYFPQTITPIDSHWIKDIASLSHEELALAAISQFVGDEIPANVLRTIVAETISFDFPVVEIEDNVGALELFHGPTLAFKDVGARFMARCLGYFNRNSIQRTVVLVATSGDTGGAVADGFLGVEGVDVVILYPSGKVSDLQEKQLTTLGKNIRALEVKGTFDDCQAMVKRAFLDSVLTDHLKLTSANSINVARWLPQMFYYFFAYKQLVNRNQRIVFAVPSGNFGNICAGMMAQRLGLPIAQFIAATNVNDTVPRYIAKGDYSPNATVSTISNAMDVSDPSNFVRILELFGEEKLRKELLAYSFDDRQTMEVISTVKKQFGYTLDPHGAVGYLGLKQFLQTPKASNDYGIFLETAHPCKFIDIVEQAISEKIDLPKRVANLVNREKKSVLIENDYKALQDYLKNNL